jgi:hypothetical protein
MEGACLRKGNKESRDPIIHTRSKMRDHIFLLMLVECLSRTGIEKVYVI